MKPLLMRSWFFFGSLVLFGILLLLFMFFGSLLLVFSGILVATVLFSKRVERIENRWRELDERRKDHE